MAIHSLQVDVYSDSSDNSPAYRVYVDGDLITERSWVWPSYEVFIRENIEVDLEPGSHYVSIVRCHGSNNFTVKRFTVDGLFQNAKDLTFNT